MDVVEIPTFAFARGSVVRRKDGGPYMLVVRSWPNRTVTVAVEGDQDGQLRMRDCPTADLKQVLTAETPAAEKR